MRQVINRKKNNSHNFSTGILVFEDGTKFFGNGIGYEDNAVGEVCFNTSITGYQEIITDPSYSDQIINFTFPHIGNVGTNPEDNEADRAWVKGIILNSDVTKPSNYRSIKKLVPSSKTKIPDEKLFEFSFFLFMTCLKYNS